MTSRIFAAMMGPFSARDFRKRKVDMSAALVILLIMVFVALILVAMTIQNLVSAVDSNTEELRKLVQFSLNPRTRISEVAIQSGAVSQEQKLSRLGRVSAARRVVVGGDEASQLNMELEAQLAREVEDNPNPTNPAMVDNE